MLPGPVLCRAVICALAVPVSMSGGAPLPASVAPFRAFNAVICPSSVLICAWSFVA